MLYSLIAVTLVGSTVGATISLPLIPTWITSLSGAATLAFAATLDSPRGDLARTIGMRVVALGQELWDIQAKLGIIPKAAIVSGQIIDKCMILDRQHKVKDRFLRLVNAGYEQVLQTADRVQQQQRQGQEREDRPRERERERGGPESDRDSYNNNRDEYDDVPTGRRSSRPMTSDERNGAMRDRNDPSPPSSDGQRQEDENRREEEEDVNKSNTAGGGGTKKRGWFGR